jgi:ribosomal protein S18 acetylase RimI-like enzyme
MKSMEEATITTAVEDQDVDVIHRFLSEESPWAKGISRKLVQQSMQNSLNFGLFVANAQVGYARVISDYATFAYLLDVFVLPEHRGRGHSRRLIDAVITHPQLQGLRRFVLVSSTARGLYQQYGFAPLARPELFMEVNVPNAYDRQT